MFSGYQFVGGLIGVRVFFLIIGFFSIFLYYEVSKIYLKQEADIYLSTFIYMLLPGIITALTLANVSILIIPLVLLFVVAYNYKILWLEAIAMLFIFLIHDASIIFFVAIFLYGLLYKESSLVLLSGVFLSLFVLLDKGVAIGGRPSGYFADVFGLYAAIFSPLLFIYFFYTIYRVLLREEKNILWCISFIALLVSLLLSVRQRIIVTDFAPYVVISVVLMLDTFNNSLRIRLLEYQKWYKMGYYTVMLLLIVSSFIIIFHKSFFYIMKNRQKHFAIKLYEPYWLAKELKMKNIKCYNSPNKKIEYQLRFYGIDKCR
jgi:hypothetical protein